VSAVVYLTGLLQGISIVAFAAAGNLFRRPGAHGLSSSEFGALFIPMILGAVLASSLAGPLARRSLRSIYFGGVLLNAVAMTAMAASQLAIGNHDRALVALMAGTGALGLGFGSLLTAMNLYAARLYPARADSAVTALHALVGIGTAIPPAILPWAERMGAWWVVPAGSAALFGVIAIAAIFTLRELPAVESVRSTGPESPTRFWGFVTAAALYGFCEAMFGDWGPLFLHEERSISVETAGLALSAFWVAVTGGRSVIAAISRWFSSRNSYRLLPVILAIACLFVPRLSGGTASIVSFVVAGLGCSAFFPLTISFGSASRPRRAESAAGLLLAAFMAGQGVGTWGVGSAHDHGLPLGWLFAASAPLALVLAVLAYSLLRAQVERTDRNVAVSSGAPR
jgi:fucose permease